MASPWQPATWLDGARAPHGPHGPLVRRGHLISSLIGHLIALIITGAEKACKNTEHVRAHSGIALPTAIDRTVARTVADWSFVFEHVSMCT